jgi:hypothetical protein
VDHRKPLLLNEQEQVTDQALREVADKHGLRICPKVALSEALDIDRAGLTGRVKNYALKASFDFVVADERTALPEFAVEFDGQRHHDDSSTIQRDGIKNGLCRQLGLPLLRIDAHWLLEIRKFTVLGWLIEVRKMYEGWLEAEAEGQVPPGEDFMYWGIVELDDDGHIADMPYDLCWKVRGYMGDALRRGVTEHFSPETIRGKDERGYTVVHAILPLASGGYLIETVRTWTFNLPPVDAYELAQDVATVLVAESLRKYELSEKVPASREVLASLRRRTEGWIREGGVLNDVPYR